MTVANLISILQCQDPLAVVSQPDPLACGGDAIKKLGVEEVQPIFVTGEEGLRLVLFKLANKDAPGVGPAVTLGAKL